MNAIELKTWLRGLAKDVEEKVILGDTDELQNIIDRINEVRDDVNIVIPHDITVKMAELKQFAAVSQLLNITKNIRSLTFDYSEAKKEVNIATQIAVKKEKNLLIPKLAEQSSQFVAILESLKSAYDAMEETFSDDQKSVKEKLVTSIDALKELKDEVGNIH